MEGDTGNQNHRGEGQGGTHTTMDRGGGDTMDWEGRLQAQPNGEQQTELSYHNRDLW